MIFLIIVLRIIHIFCGVFWVGFGFFNVFFLQPTIKSVGPEGQKVMQHLTQKTRLLNTVYSAATLTLLSGFGLYWFVSGFDITFIASAYGKVLTAASIAGIIGWYLAVFIISSIFRKMKIIGGQIQAAGTPPTPEQAHQMQLLVGQLGKMGKITVFFLIIALLGMSFARYSNF